MIIFYFIKNLRTRNHIFEDIANQSIYLEFNILRMKRFRDEMYEES